MPYVSCINGKMWMTKSLVKYEQGVISGKIECPFTVEHENSSGRVVATTPLPLTPTGKCKLDIFGWED